MEHQATIMSKGRMQCLVASVFDKLTYQNSKGLNCSIDLTLLSQLENLTRVTSAFFFSSSFYYLFFVFGTALSPQCWGDSARHLPCSIGIFKPFLHSLKKLFEIQYLLSHGETCCHRSPACLCWGHLEGDPMLWSFRYFFFPLYP